MAAEKIPCNIQNVSVEFGYKNIGTNLKTKPEQRINRERYPQDFTGAMQPNPDRLPYAGTIEHFLDKSI